MVIDNWALLYW